VRLLLDTHVLLWILGAPHRLRDETRAQVESGENEILFSAASIWEIAIKAALGRADFRVSPEAIVEAALQSGFVELPVHSAAASKVATLPLHHRDPFDRLLIAQAMTEPARLYTSDAALEAYSELVVRV
jgi:PIN domain nuclease of toxin-antitoxin system